MWTTAMEQPEPFQFDESRLGALRRRALYPDCYTWTVFISAMDLMFTWVIFHLDGWEANPLAAYIIDQFGLWGTVLFKFGLLVMVILICEFVGRRKPGLGRVLAISTVLIPLSGVLMGAALMLRAKL